jgi:hypothetical protein
MTTLGAPFPGRAIITEFQATEERLLEPLRHIPYCTAHESVWSPELAACIIDACHQLDSLWKLTAGRYGYRPRGRDFNITDYHERFGVPNTPSTVYRRWAVFWADQPLPLHPFAPWDGGTYAQLPWWDAYNTLKHDRWANKERATLKEAIHAVAALFLGIVRCEYASDAVGETGWLSSKQVSDAGNPSHQRNLPQRLIEDSGPNAGYAVAAESKLFAYPVGYWERKIVAADKWSPLAPCSNRFRNWFDNFTSP